VLEVEDVRLGDLSCAVAILEDQFAAERVHRVLERIDVQERDEPDRTGVTANSFL
jgi:non-ribosomal peptide synthetase component E (peptide arylation enzyme)